MKGALDSAEENRTRPTERMAERDTLTGRTIGRYLIGAKLGEGGMRAVYQAREQNCARARLEALKSKHAAAASYQAARETTDRLIGTARQGQELQTVEH